MSPRSEESFKKIRDRSRSKILEAAMEQFSHYGYDGSSMKRVAERAGVSKGLLYNYFSSKKELLLAIFHAGMEEMDKIVEEGPAGGPRTRLIGMFELFFKDLQENPGFWRLFSTLALREQGFPEIRELMQQKVDGYYAILARIFRDLGYENPEGEAEIVCATFDGIAVEYLALGPDFPLQRIRQHIMKKYGNDAST
jgi:AcrR family transcriptional regulator